jgi:asparagine synthase (glutamine-hydrolysing)
MKLVKYWDIDLSVTNHSISETDAKARLHDLLSSSVSRRLRSDVAIGSSLSGGLDSSIIVALLDKLDVDKSIRRKTFSASFPGFKKDETKYQQIVIENTSVEPHFVYPDEASFFENFEKISYHQDEPFGSASINIQYEVFKKAKEEGADEIFAGYHGYYHSFFDELRARGNGKLKKEFESYRSLHADNQINPEIQVGNLGFLKRALPSSIKNAARNHLVKLPAAKKVLSKDFYTVHKSSLFQTKEEFPDLSASLYYSVFNVGLEELLRYADRNSMAHSREVRLPFLNHDLVSFVFSLPSHYKIREGWTKWILRSAFEEQLDPRIVWRKDKIGYEPPQKEWLSNPRFSERVGDALQDLKNKRIVDKHLTIDQLATDSLLMWRVVMISKAGA